MDTDAIIAALDAEIAKRQEARALLSGIATATVSKIAAAPAKKPGMSAAARDRKSTRLNSSH